MGRRPKYATEEERQEARKEYFRNWQKQRTHAKTELLIEFRARGCAVCGETHHACLDAHHIGDKSEGVSRLLFSGTLEEFAQELSKCICLCANCHRKHHAGYPVLSREGLKECGKCHEWLPLEKFELRYDKNGPKRRATCRMCRGLHTRSHRASVQALHRK